MLQVLFVYPFASVGLTSRFIRCIVIDQFDSSTCILSLSDAKGMLAIESENKNIQLGVTFKILGYIAHNFHIVMIIFMCFELGKKVQVLLQVHIGKC